MDKITQLINSLTKEMREGYGDGERGQFTRFLDRQHRFLHTFAGQLHYLNEGELVLERLVKEGLLATKEIDGTKCYVIGDKSDIAVPTRVYKAQKDERKQG